MFYARFTIEEQTTEKLYFDFDEYWKDTFSPLTRVECFIEFKLHGRDYKTRKSSLKDIAVDWSNHGNYGHLFMSDLWNITDWFYRNGKRYCLLEEFRENGLC